MRPKYILWLIVTALALSWYLLDPEARRDAARTDMAAAGRVVSSHRGRRGRRDRSF